MNRKFLTVTFNQLSASFLKKSIKNLTDFKLLNSMCQEQMTFSVAALLMRACIHTYVYTFNKTKSMI